MQLQELTDWVALHEQNRTKRTRSTHRIPETIAPDVPASQVLAFEDAGWVFQERSSRELPEGVTPVKVFVRPGGRLALGTDFLTVQFPDDPVEEQANAMLQPYGCRVVERLTFAPGLFQVVITDQARGDIVDLANQLEDSGLVKFAEPVLIEAMGPRSP